jgi:hypothetical protein
MGSIVHAALVLVLIQVHVVISGGPLTTSFLPTSKGDFKQRGGVEWRAEKGEWRAGREESQPGTFFHVLG